MKGSVEGDAKEGYTEEVTCECFWPSVLGSSLDRLE